MSHSNERKRTVIIQGPGLILPDPALEYLKLNSHRPFTFYSDDDVEGVIKAEYAKGVRQFILSIISSQIMQIMPLIQALPRAKFVSPTSTVISLRGASPNLYFTSTSNVYIELCARSLEFVKPVTAVVYTDLSDPFIAEVVAIAQAFGYKTFSITDPNWISYPVIVLVTLPAEADAWKQLISQLLPPPRQYSIYSIENAPPPIAFPGNVTNITIAYPSASVQPQMNSYWNIACKSPLFSDGPAWANPYPVLINQRWKFLIQANLMAPTYQRNNIYLARYLPIYNIHPRFNLQNPNVLAPAQDLIWLISTQYYNKMTRANLSALQELNPKIRKIQVVSNVKRAVRKYWACGWRQFVLQCPSDDVIKVQKLGLCGGLFICTRATAPSIREPGSSFVFGLTDDTTMIQNEIAATARATNFETICLLGSSDNIEMKSFRSELDRNGIKWLNVDAIQKVTPETSAIFVVGNESDYDGVLSYIQTHRAQFPQLSKLSSYGRYISQSDLKTWAAIGMKGEAVTNNYNSSQPFLESEYSTVSRPTYLTDEISFWDLSNILLRFPLDFLFAFGYIIDL